MARSETEGDVRAFGINLELKTTQVTGGKRNYPSHVKYSTLGDREHYGEGLVSWAQKKRTIDGTTVFSRPSDPTFILDKSSWITQQI